jgi:hypothetical protein
MRMRLVRFRHVPHGQVEKFERASPHDHPVIAPLSLSLGDCGFGAGWLSSFCVRPQACTRARPGVSIVRMCPVYAAVASILEVAMASLPVSDSRERPKQRDAIRDAIFGKNFFDCFWFTHFLAFDIAYAGATPCFRKPPQHCAALLHTTRPTAPSRFGASPRRGTSCSNPSTLGLFYMGACVTCTRARTDIAPDVSSSSHVEQHTRDATRGSNRW